MSKRLHKFTSAAELLLINATAAPFPPVSFGAVPDAWGNQSIGVLPEFDLDMRAATTGSVTALKLYGGRLIDLVNADDTFTATNATETFTAVAHGLQTGDGPFVVSNSGGALPAGLVAGTQYWIIKVDNDNFKLAASFAEAGAGTAVAITTDGTGTHTLSDVDGSTKQIVWHKHGDIEATLTLAAREGYTVPCAHKSDVAAYALVWTGTAASALRGSAIPCEDRQ